MSRYLTIECYYEMTIYCLDHLRQVCFYLLSLYYFKLFFQEKPRTDTMLRLLNLKKVLSILSKAKGEAKFSVKSSSLHSSVHVEITREILCAS